MSNKSNITLSSKSKLNDNNNNKYQNIHVRIDFIKNLLKDNELTPLVDFDNTETEAFMAKYNNTNNSNSDDSIDSNDARSCIKKKVFDFKKIIHKIGGSLEYIKSGSSGHTFKGFFKDQNNNEVNYAVKVVAYPKKDKYGNINDINRPENAELLMIKLLSYFVVKQQSPHVVLPIGTFNTSILRFVKLIDDKIIDEDNKNYKKFVERYKNGDYYDQVSILISEWANRGDLLDFLRHHYMDSDFTLLKWKVIFFQILSILALIQNKFPSFRHNDLKANNILVHENGINPEKPYYTYTIMRNKYHVPNIGYQIKLWDFDFSCIPGIVNNSKVSSKETAKWRKEINVTPEQNRYYDIHYFFNTLIKKGFFPEIMTDECIPIEVKDFINRIVPCQYQTGVYVHKRGRILINTEITTPNEIITRDPFFAEFRTPTVEKNNSHKQENKKKHKKKIETTSLSKNTKNINDKIYKRKQKIIFDEIEHIKLEDLLSE